VGEWGAFTLRNVTYLTRDLTHEGGGYQHLNNNGGSSAATGAAGGGGGGDGDVRKSSNNAFGLAGAGDYVQQMKKKVWDARTQPEGQFGQQQQQQQQSTASQGNTVHNYYDLSFMSQLREEDQVTMSRMLLVIHSVLKFLRPNANNLVFYCLFPTSAGLAACVRPIAQCLRGVFPKRRSLHSSYCLGYSTRKYLYFKRW
jgi:hypothetical protein